MNNARNLFEFEIKNNTMNNQITEDVRTCHEIRKLAMYHLLLILMTFAN